MPTQFSSKPVTAINAINDTALEHDRHAESVADFKFQLTNRLQSSLDLGEVLTHFFEMIQSIVTSSGINYCYPQKVIQISIGNSRAHSACYNLKVARHYLGEITFYRAKRFSENELANVETLLGLLVLPLRNAILYRDALEHSLLDPLTGIGNRMALESALKREFELAKRTSQSLSLVIADLDLFKQVNDTAGHVIGDTLIKKTATAIQAAVRQSDQVFRFGGEEYVVILSNTPNTEALLIAERVRQAIANIHVPSKIGLVRPTISLGVSTLRESDSKESLLERADAALYQAKADGRNAVVSAE